MASAGIDSGTYVLTLDHVSTSIDTLLERDIHPFFAAPIVDAALGEPDDTLQQLADLYAAVKTGSVDAAGELDNLLDGLAEGNDFQDTPRLSNKRERRAAKERNGQ